MTFLNQFKLNADIHFITLFNDEGFLLASTTNDDISTRPDFYQDFAALSSGILAMAQSMVKITNPESIVTKISVQGGEECESDCFGLIVRTLSDEIHLVVCYPWTSNYGLFIIEFNKIAELLKDYLSKVQEF